jgi:hypothetical protein
MADEDLKQEERRDFVGWAADVWCLFACIHIISQLLRQYMCACTIWTRLTVTKDVFEFDMIIS